MEGYDGEGGGALNRKRDEWRQGWGARKKTKLCLVNEVTNWVETCSPNPFPTHARQEIKSCWNSYKGKKNMLISSRFLIAKRPRRGGKPLLGQNNKWPLLWYLFTLLPGIMHSLWSGDSFLPLCDTFPSCCIKSRHQKKVNVTSSLSVAWFYITASWGVRFALPRWHYTTLHYKDYNGK